jgi:hypothetical protein
MGQNATYIKIQFDSTDLIGELSNSVNSTADIIDVSSKASGLERNILPGRVAENISFESLADDASSDYGWAAAYAAMTAGTIVTFSILKVDADGDPVTGGQNVTGSGYFSSLTKDNPDNDRSTFSGTLEIDDEITIAPYSAP